MRKAGRDFIGSAVVRKSNAARRCEAAIQRGVITIRRFVAFLWRLKAFNAYSVRKCLEIAMNKNSLALSA
ncbi:hypothetical protein CAMGR0001_0837 [Campylobacter gracilis RM3268]|uniref:Uncharacterized protein n=1 Tax=Campylobacter gracilis RM3268 TaxID=553220 RepID=C8PG44_9BACT|nr:hypothetical protein CAMGR0001_0837 [Campylobacter gracilis RM3268]